MVRKIILFVSSYIPLYVLLIVKNILERITNKGRFMNSFNKKIMLFDEINDYAVVVLFLLCVISFGFLKKKIKSTGGNKHYKVIAIEDETSNYYFNYISIYLLSCLGLSLNNIVDVFVLTFLMILVGYIYISNKMTYINPTLNLLGYKVYDTELNIMAMNTESTFNSIILAPKREVIKKGIIIIGTGKQDFIFVKNVIDDN